MNIAFRTVVATLHHINDKILAFVEAKERSNSLWHSKFIGSFQIGLWCTYQVKSSVSPRRLRCHTETSVIVTRISYIYRPIASYLRMRITNIYALFPRKHKHPRRHYLHGQESEKQRRHQAAVELVRKGNWP